MEREIRLHGEYIKQQIIPQRSSVYKEQLLIAVDGRMQRHNSQFTCCGTACIFMEIVRMKKRRSLIKDIIQQ